MKNFKPLLSHSPSRESAEHGKMVFLGFQIGIMKAQVDKAKRKLEPYRLPCESWAQRYAPFNENTIKNIKRWYDIGY